MSGSGGSGMQKMLPEAQPKRKHPLHPLCARTAFSCNKLLLFIYALVFMFVGIILMAIGVLVELHRNRIESVSSRLAVPTAMLIMVGLVIAFNALCGMVGALMEKPLLLKVFFIATIICFLLQVTIGIIAFVCREKLPHVVSSEFMFAVKGYSAEDDKIKTTIDWLQKKYQCCGFSSYRDYQTENDFFSCDSGVCGVPKSCCTQKEGLALPESCGYGIDNKGMLSAINAQGCTQMFIKWLMDHLDLVGAIALGFAIPQIFGILLSYYFLRKVKEYRVWYRVDNFRS